MQDLVVANATWVNFASGVVVTVITLTLGLVTPPVGSVLITSQLPIETWHEVIGEPTFADAILDRLVHNAYRLTLDGPSMRDPKTGKTEHAVVTAEAADAVAANAGTAKAAKAAKK